MQGGARHPTEEAFLAGDALRALACVQVFVFHAAFGAAGADGLHPRVIGDTGADLNDAYGPVDPLVELAPLAVYVFFSLSGYLLARRFVRAFVDGTRRPAIPTFLRNRALRILPALWFVIALSLLRYGTGGSSVWEVLALPLNLQVYVHGPVTNLIAHAWTINTEWALYLGLPLAALALPALAGRRLDRRGRLALVAGALAAVYAASLLARALGPVDTYYQRGFWAASWAFVPGVALAVAEVAFAERLRGARRGPAVAIALLAGCALATAAFLSTDPAAAGRRAVLASAAVLLLLAAPLLLQWSTGRAWRLLDNRPLKWLGERSYGFYLLHFLIGVEVSRLLAGEDARASLPLTMPITFVLTCAAAHLCYRYVESPFLVRKARQAPGAGTTGREGVAGDDVVAAR